MPNLAVTLHLLTREANEYERSDKGNGKSLKDR